MKLKQTFGLLTFVVCGSECVGQTGVVPTAKISKQTHVYKRVGDLQIKLDVFRPADDKVRPLVVWIHGGALIGGHRDNVDRRLKESLLARGLVLVSIDYRLAPESKLPDILQDVEDAFAWLRHHAAEKLRANPDRIAVAGGSAGGYLTLATGYRVRPRPVALVSLYGYGDLIGPWYSQPSPHRRHNKTKIARADALKQVAGPPIADARDRKGDGGVFYNYCRQTGTWPTAVSGWNPATERDKFVPFMPLANVTADYPPTLLIHGDMDTDVPFEQSTLMAAELQRRGVEHRLIRVANAEHGLTGADRKDFAAAYQAATDFIARHLSPLATGNN